MTSSGSNAGQYRGSIGGGCYEAGSSLKNVFGHEHAWEQLAPVPPLPSPFQPPAATWGWPSVSASYRPQLQPQREKRRPNYAFTLYEQAISNWNHRVQLAVTIPGGLLLPVLYICRSLARSSGSKFLAQNYNLDLEGLTPSRVIPGREGDSQLAVDQKMSSM